MEFVIAIIALVISLCAGAAIIYLYVRVFNNEKTFDTRILEIKSKIGSIIRDINIINRMEYEVDMEQQQKLNTIAQRVI